MLVTGLLDTAQIHSCPAQVAKVLVLLHNELLSGIEATLNKLRQTAPVPPSASQRERVRQRYKI